MIALPRAAPGLAILPPVTGDLREWVDTVLTAFLDDRPRSRASGSTRRLCPPVEEVRRLLRRGEASGSVPRSATGDSARPAGQDDGDAGDGDRARRGGARAPAHDGARPRRPDRRGEGATRSRLDGRVVLGSSGGARGVEANASAFGQAMSILVGDLAAVFADRLLLESGFPLEALARALAVYHPMREEMAIGQYLDLSRVVDGGAGDPQVARRAAATEGRRLHRGGAAADRRRARRGAPRP